MAELGNIQEVKKQVSKEAFTFYIGVNMIGNWKSDGWGILFAERSEFLPYISNALKELKLASLKDEFDKIFSKLSLYFELKEISLFEKGINGELTMDYDVVNFLLNPRFKLENEALNDIEKDERKAMSDLYRNAINTLDNISEKLWGYEAKEDGWKDIIDFLSFKR